MDDGWRNLLPATVERATGAIYHYTDPAGLLGVLEKRELWATEATGMNDLAEVRQGWDFVQRWVDGWEGDDKIAGIIASACDPEHPVRSSEGVFMCCASTRPNDANQWRLYAAGARGYSIELDADQPLAAMARSDEPPKPRTAAHSDATRRYRTTSAWAVVSPWLRVLYTDSDKEAALNGLAANAHAAWQAQVDAGFTDEEHYDIAGQEFRDGLATDVARIAQLMKSEGFAGEDEVRVIVTLFWDSCSRFRSTDNGVVRYVRLTGLPPAYPQNTVVYGKELGGAKSLPVRSVWLGPLISAQNNVRTVEALLGRNGLQAAGVYESGLPLRG